MAHRWPQPIVNPLQVLRVDGSSLAGKALTPLVQMERADSQSLANANHYLHSLHTL